MVLFAWTASFLTSLFDISVAQHAALLRTVWVGLVTLAAKVLPLVVAMVIANLIDLVLTRKLRLFE